MRALVGLVISAVIVLSACTLGDDDAGGRSVCETVGCQLAVIDGDAFGEDDVDSTRANFLVNAIAPRCGISAERVGDMVVAGRNQLRDRFGVQVKTREILETVNISTSGRSGLDCASVIAAYVVGRGS